MICIKVMSGEEIPDGDQKKCHKFIFPNDENFTFSRVEDGKCFLIISPDFIDDNFDVRDGLEASKIYELHGNAYVLQDGKTIASFKVNSF